MRHMILWGLAIAVLMVVALGGIMLASRGKTWGALPGRVVHTFPDGKQLVLLQVGFENEHKLVYRQAGRWSEGELTLRASGIANRTLGVWLGVYDPRTQAWAKPQVRQSLIQVGEDAYLPERFVSRVESRSGDRAYFIIPLAPDPDKDLPVAEPLLYAIEPTTASSATLWLWLDSQTQPLRVPVDLPASVPRPESITSAARLPQRQRAGAVEVEFHGLKYGNYTVGDRLGTFLAPDLRVWVNGKPDDRWGAYIYEIGAGAYKTPPVSLTPPPAAVSPWAVTAYVQCYDPTALTRDQFSDYTDVTVPAPHPQQIIPIGRTLKAADVQLRALALVGAGELHYRKGEPLPTQTRPLPKGAASAFFLSHQEAYVVSDEPYLLCELTLPEPPDGSYGAGYHYVAFGGDAEEVEIFIAVVNAQGKRVHLSSRVMDDVLKQVKSNPSLVAIPLETENAVGQLRMRLGVQRRRVVSFLMPLMQETAQVARAIQSALAWYQVGEFQRFEQTLQQCLRDHADSRDPLTLASLGLFCTLAPLPSDSFKPLLGRLKQLAQQEPDSYAYQLAFAATAVRAGRPKDALPSLKRLHSLSDSDPLVYLWYARALLAAGEREQAAKVATPQLLDRTLQANQHEDDLLRRGAVQALVDDLRQGM